MTFNSFERLVENYMKEKFIDYRIDIRDVRKNNDILLRGMTVCFEGVSACPTIYLDDMYEQYKRGVSLEEILCEHEKVFRNARLDADWNTDFLCDIEWVKKNVYCKLINTEMNKELLLEVPSIEYLDLSAVFYVVLDVKEDGFGTILINNNMFEKMNIKIEELFLYAKENYKENFHTKIMPIEDILKDLLDDEAIEVFKNEETILYVMTNQKNRFGATSVLDEHFLRDFSEIIESDFYILPSSIHEVILLPVEKAMKLNELRDMVTEINKTQVAKVEVLSNNVYLYSKNTHTVMIA